MTTLSEDFLRGGVEVIKNDSVYCNKLSDVNEPSTSDHPYSLCMVQKSYLGEHELDKIHPLGRTWRGTKDGLSRVAQARSNWERDALSRELEVVI